jgi:hypothetical protein
MPAKRERGFRLNVKKFSAKRSRCKNEQIKVLGLGSCSSLRTGNEPVQPRLTPAGSDHVEQGFVSTQETESETAKTKYEQRKDAESLEWTAVREELINTFTSLEAPVTFVCSICQANIAQPIRCLDCYPMFTCCTECEVKFHDSLLHKPEIWNVSKFSYGNLVERFYFIFLLHLVTFSTSI